MKDNGLAELVKKAQKDKGVVAVLLFGSRATGKDTAKSDVDVCLILADRKQAFEKSAKFGEINRNLDASEFYSLPLYVRQRVLREGKILFCRDRKLLHQAASATIKEMRHYGRHYNYYLRKMAHGRQS